MLAKPNEKPSWANNDYTDVNGVNNVVRPSTAKQDIGDTFQEKPLYQFRNWLFRWNRKWIDYFESVTDKLLFVLGVTNNTGNDIFVAGNINTDSNLDVSGNAVIDGNISTTNVNATNDIAGTNINATASLTLNNIPASCPPVGGVIATTTTSLDPATLYPGTTWDLAHNVIPFMDIFFTGEDYVTPVPKLQWWRRLT
jgi:hypothetical protein